MFFQLGLVQVHAGVKPSGPARLGEDHQIAGEFVAGIAGVAIVQPENK